VPLVFTPGEAGSYVATPGALPAGRWQVSARATRDGREVGRARSEFAVDRWSLEALRADPDSATLAAIASASGGRLAPARDAARWAHDAAAHGLVARRSASTRLWESPWLFACVVGLLAAEWTWRRRRGLP